MKPDLIIVFDSSAEPVIEIGPVFCPFFYAYLTLTVWCVILCFGESLGIGSIQIIK